MVDGFTQELSLKDHLTGFLIVFNSYDKISNSFKLRENIIGWLLKTTEEHLRYYKLISARQAII